MDNKNVEPCKDKYPGAVELACEEQRPKQTNWQLGGSCFTDRYCDFRSSASAKEVRWGVL